MSLDDRHPVGQMQILESLAIARFRLLGPGRGCLQEDGHPGAMKGGRIGAPKVLVPEQSVRGTCRRVGDGIGKTIFKALQFYLTIISGDNDSIPDGSEETIASR